MYSTKLTLPDVPAARALSGLLTDFQVARFLLHGALDSLEYVDQAHPGQVTGNGVRAERIAQIRAFLDRTTDG